LTPSDISVNKVVTLFSENLGRLVYSTVVQSVAKISTIEGDQVPTEPSEPIMSI